MDICGKVCIITGSAQAEMLLPLDPDCFLIGRACRVFSIWWCFALTLIEPHSAYWTGMTNQQTGSKTITPIVKWE